MLVRDLDSPIILKAHEEFDEGEAHPVGFTGDIHGLREAVGGGLMDIAVRGDIVPDSDTMGGASGTTGYDDGFAVALAELVQIFDELRVGVAESAVILTGEFFGREVLCGPRIGRQGSVLAA